MKANHIEAMKQALEALEYQGKPLCMCFAGCDNCDPAKAPDIESAVTALREALAEQPAQQVVDCHATGVCVQSGLRAEQPTQRTWVGLTEQEALDCFSPNPVTHSKNVEAKLKEKNT